MRDYGKRPAPTFLILESDPAPEVRLPSLQVSDGMLLPFWCVSLRKQCHPPYHVIRCHQYAWEC